MTKLVPFAYAGGPKVGSAVNLAVGIANWAAKENCDWDPDKEGGNVDPRGPTGCKVAGDYCLQIRAEWHTGITPEFDGYIKEFEYIRLNDYTNKDGDPMVQITWKGLKREGWIEGERNYERHLIKRVYVRAYGPCVEDCENAPQFGPDVLPPDTYQHTTEEGCTLNVNFKSLVQDNDGNVGGLWEIAPAAETRANAGGIIRGCFFNPTMYYDGGGSGRPPRTFPVPPLPPPGDDWWKDLLGRALAGAGGNLLASAIKELVKPVITKSEFVFTAPCDVDEEDRHLQVVYQFPDQDYQARVLSQQAVIMEILQQHLNWKTPVCFGNDQAGKYWRSITFESTTYSDDSNSRLVKRFRYRSNSPGDVRQLAEHWRDFTWNTGGVIVKHTGSPLGSPQVWAASVDEGKRVIQHAGGEAGVDPNQTGKWTVGGTNSPRYGVQRTVVLKQVDGCWMATARQGPEGWPEAAIVTPDRRGPD